ncbi:uncharacterized protein [Pseudorasbora parva]|uniref:uncharacterized protein isoform X2 n=1 Tax=Pseudorasbora parva TaxID=51549 RepID=UPI00351E102F
MNVEICSNMKNLLLFFLVSFFIEVVPADPVKTDPVSVMEGDSVTLKTAVNEILKYDVIRWRFGYQNSPIAEINRTVGLLSLSVGPDGRFRDRLQMDYLTGSLTIMNITTKHSGLYEVDISNSKHTIHKSFRVTVRDSDSGSGSGSGSGLSAGAVVGMCVALLVFGALAGAVIYCRCQIYEVNRQKLHVVWVTEGEYVALDPYRTEIREDDGMQWKFRGALIAERRGVNGEITVHDERFKDRLQLEKDSGCLITKDTSPNMSGDYELQILRRGHQLLKTFTVFVFDETETDVVKEGDSLNIKVTGIHTDDQMQWKFVFGREDSPIAQIKGGIPKIFPSAAGGRFRDRLKLDPTGSLTIKKIRPTDAGVYHLYNTKTRKSMKSFRVNVLNPEDNGNNPDGTPLTHFYVS